MASLNNHFSNGHISEDNTMSTNQSTQTLRIGVWDLDKDASTDDMPPEHAHSFHSMDHPADSEDIIGDTDDRTAVEKEHFMPGGKYRSIVKLFLRYQGPRNGERPWAMATGWLIEKDLLVTAGHCAFDWSNNQGHLTNVKAYIGYSGKRSIKDDAYEVQGRIGTRVATTSKWLESRAERQRDVSFIRLNKPFEGVVPYTFKTTPTTGGFKLGVVGYPGDRIEGTEKGAIMYEMFEDTDYDIDASSSKMLEYEIDTFGGNSGSPVFQEEDLSAIGVHVYGGLKNSASIINGQYGNNFSNYILVIKSVSGGISSNPSVAVKQDTANNWLTWASVFTVDNGGESTFDPPPGGITSAEGFFDVFRDGLSAVSNIAGTVLQTGLPLALGPVGVPLGALAGVALHTAGNLAQKRPESAETNVTYAHDGVAERAILGEAALAAVVKLAKESNKGESVFTFMTGVMKKIGPVVERVAPKVLGAIAEPALRVALAEIGKSQTPKTESFHSDVRDFKTLNEERKTSVFGGLERTPSQEAFIEGLSKSITVKDAAHFLTVPSTIGDVLGQGLRVADPILQSVAQNGLSQLVPSTESEIDKTPGPFDHLAERAIAGEAALQALMKMDPARLQTEGLFDTMRDVITKIGPTVLQVAPQVIQTVTPFVRTMLSSSRTESLFSNHESPKDKEKESFSRKFKATHKRGDRFLKVKEAEFRAFLAPDAVLPGPDVDRILNALRDQSHLDYSNPETVRNVWWALVAHPVFRYDIVLQEFLKQHPTMGYPPLVFGYEILGLNAQSTDLSSGVSGPLLAQAPLVNTYAFLDLLIKTGKIEVSPQTNEFTLTRKGSSDYLTMKFSKYEELLVQAIVNIRMNVLLNAKVDTNKKVLEKWKKYVVFPSK